MMLAVEEMPQMKSLSPGSPSTPRKAFNIQLYRDEMLQLAIILSLLRVDPDSYLGYDVPAVGVGIHDLTDGTSWAHAQTLIHRRLYLHPKSLDSVLLNYEQEVFEDLNALGRYNRINLLNRDVTAYLLNVDGVSPNDVLENSGASGSSLGSGSERESRDPFISRPGPSAQVESEKTADNLSPGAELTQEDMDLIEVLWKQDVDLGFSLDLFSSGKSQHSVSDDKLSSDDPETEDELDKLKSLAALNKSGLKSEDDDSSVPTLDPWAGLAYTVDLETGEYVLKDGLVDELSNAGSGLTDEEPSALIDLPEFSLEGALQLFGLDENSTEVKPEEASSPLPGTTANTNSTEPSKDESPEADTPDEERGIVGDMIQTAPFHHPSARPFQGRMPLVRAMSMEQRWQDLANLLSLPGPGEAHAHHFAHHHHHHHHSFPPGSAYSPDNTRGVLLHNATLAPPMGDLNASSPYPNVTMSGASNLGSAVATSMNLTNSSEPMGDGAPSGPYKMEGPHDMMYYQNSSSEMNQTTEGFLSSILNDEDLQLMDMAMNEGMYTMRMLEANSSNNASSVGVLGTSEERMDASSDSAVSSMGSERVPSLSDGEWMETGSDSGHTPGDHYSVDYHASKYRAYDYSYSSRQHSGPTVGAADTAQRMPPMAQKKHQMFGKRYFQEQGSGGSLLGSHGATANLPTTPIKFEYGEAAAPGNAFSGPVEGAVGAKPPEMKYSCSMEFARHHADPRPTMEHVQHNHSYHLPPESSGTMQRPLARDKQKGRRSEEEHLNRDEKRARAMNIPMTVSDIINLPMDEFNERLSKYDLSEAQLSLIRDIRRRGKNKVAAQNCRKRKLDQILSLADEVKEMRDRKNRLVHEREYMLAERQRVKDKFSQLYRHVFQALRDADGNQYSPYEYSLQQSADGSVLLVPRTNASAMLDPEPGRHKHKDHEHPRKE